MTNVSNGTWPNNSSKPADELWTNPYLLSILAITIITILPTLISVLFVCRKPHQFNFWCLFLVEMAVGSLTTEAVVHLIPALVVLDKSVETGVPHYFPYLATMSALVCVLHALDTASVVFTGRRQSSSHAMEWREGNQHIAARQNHTSVNTGPQTQHWSEMASLRSDDSIKNELQKNSQASADINDLTLAKQEAPDNQEDRNSVRSFSDRTLEFNLAREGQEFFSHSDDNKFYCRQSSLLNEFKKMAAELQLGTIDEQSTMQAATEPVRSARVSEATIFEALKNPRNCLNDGPYRLCSIISAGAILHSFAHGLAIGAAYVKKWDYGLHLSVSVGLHELAHRVADFVVLTASGFSIKAVMLLNVCYHITSTAGVLVSVPLSKKSKDLRLWITTVATAVFVYFSLVTMSSMVRKNYKPKNVPAFFVGNAGIVVGYLLIMLASLLEIYV